MCRIAYPEHSVLVNRRGDEYPIHGSASPILDQTGQVLGAVLAISDVSQERQLTRQMAYQATHDALTQLPNRALLEDRLQHALAHAHRSGQLAVLFFIDLDRFKNVNDALGHSTGDVLLKAVAIRLKAACREEDTIVRLGGDEFVVLLENLHHQEQANIVAQKVLRSIKSPFRLDHHEFFITCSIGISLYPRDGQDAETLLKNADAAMYRAKETGRNNIQYYAQDLNARALERLIMERKLRFAASQGELNLCYQPLYGAQDGELVGAEALLRWSHPELGTLPPSEFIPLAEDTDLVIEIGEWVLGAACRQAKAWQDEGLPIPRVAINLSARQFMQPDFTDTMARVLEMTDLAGHHVELEITEDTLMSNASQTIDTLHALKALGVHLSVDDFGTGYSSMSYLKQFPIDRLKIDRSFVHDVDTDPDNAAISQAIIAMAHSMHLKVVAEGVETPAQAEYLRAQRCDEIQGYLLSRPLPAAELTAMLRTLATQSALGRAGTQGPA
jgi:diguanylate cyclase (GGDEF)-like protein